MGRASALLNARQNNITSRSIERACTYDTEQRTYEISPALICRSSVSILLGHAQVALKIWVELGDSQYGSLDSRSLPREVGIRDGNLSDPGTFKR